MELFTTELFTLETDFELGEITWTHIDSWCSRRYNPPFSLPFPISFHLTRSCMKQRLERKNMQHFKEAMSLLTEIKLKEKTGTHRTSTRMRESDNLTIPICVTNTDSPLGSSTLV
jgi:hypothetical protein